MNLGLKENNYPIKEIEMNMDVPLIENKLPTIVKKIDFNTMTHYNYNYENSKVNIKFTNEVNEKNEILWKKSGSEKVVLTFLYDKDIKIDETKINNDILTQPSITITLYDGKELTSIENIKVSDLKEEKEELISVNTTNIESEMYKGKLNAGIDREYISETNLSVNLANAEQYVKIRENSDYTVFNKTTINKDEFSKILGNDGQITILNENSDIIAIVNNETEIDEITQKGEEHGRIDDVMKHEVQRSFGVAVQIGRYFGAWTLA